MAMDMQTLKLKQHNLLASINKLRWEFFELRDTNWGGYDRAVGWMDTIIEDYRNQWRDDVDVQRAKYLGMVLDLQRVITRYVELIACGHGDIEAQRTTLKMLEATRNEALL